MNIEKPYPTTDPHQDDEPRVPRRPPAPMPKAAVLETPAAVEGFPALSAAIVEQLAKLHACELDLTRIAALDVDEKGRLCAAVAADEKTEAVPVTLTREELTGAKRREVLECRDHIGASFNAMLDRINRLLGQEHVTPRHQISQADADELERRLAEASRQPERPAPVRPVVETRQSGIRGMAQRLAPRRLVEA